jgi:hypothetical protein
VPGVRLFSENLNFKINHLKISSDKTYGKNLIPDSGNLVPATGPPRPELLLIPSKITSTSESFNPFQKKKKFKPSIKGE